MSDALNVVIDDGWQYGYRKTVWGCYEFVWEGDAERGPSRSQIVSSASRSERLELVRRPRPLPPEVVDASSSGEFLLADLCEHEVPEGGDKVHVSGEPSDLIYLATPIKSEVK